MTRSPFVTPAMSILLDAVRAGAALVVLVGHMVKMGIYTGPYPFGSLLTHHAVIVFFVLSGLVITHSVRQRHSTLRDYAIARAARIMPVSVFAVISGTLIYFGLILSGFASPPPHENVGQLLVSTVVVPLVFLGEGLIDGKPLLNQPYWSLTYEVWFYALFGAAWFLEGSRRRVWLAILAILAGWRVLLMLPVWLTGVALDLIGTHPKVHGWRAAILALGATVLMATAAAYAEEARYLSYLLIGRFGFNEGFTEYFIADYALALGVAAFFAALRPFAEWSAPVLQQVERPVRYAAGFSFSLYILHWPLISALAALGVRVGDSIFGFVGVISAVLAACAFAARLIEHRSREVRSWLSRLTASPHVASALT